MSFIVSLLVVCSANVCRSVHASTLLSEAVGDRHGSSTFVVTSAGTRTRPGAQACSLVMSLADARGGRGASLLARHRSARITVEALDAADLILTATLEHRSSIASMSPDARAKAFSLQEAATLAEGLRLRSPDDDALEFSEWVRRLDASRGHVPRVSTRTPWRKSMHNEFDIPDGHLESRRHHRHALEDVAQAVARLVDAFPAFGGSSERPDLTSP